MAKNSSSQYADGEPLEGRYHLAGFASSDATRLFSDGKTGSIRFSDSRADIDVEIASVSDRLGSVARKIRFTDGSIFEARDNDAVDQLFGTHQSFLGRVAGAESSWRIVAVLAVVTIGLLVGIYRYGLPALASGAASVTPTSVSTLIDKGALQSVDQIFFEESKLPERRQRELTALFVELVHQSGHTEPKLRLLFRDGARMGANAIALPGGTIILTDQLEEEAKSTDELAGVLAHEIGHVELRHSLRQIYRLLGIGFMISVVGGDSGQLVEDIIGHAAALETLSYSREFETEADYRSAQIMVGLDRDPYAFIELLGRLTDDKEEKESTSWFSTHPGTFDRRATVKKFIDSLER